MFCKETVVLHLLKQLSWKQFPSVVGEMEYFTIYNLIPHSPSSTYSAQWQIKLI